MTDMITVSRKEIEDAIDTLYIETFSGEPYIAGTRKILALLDKAEVVSGEPVAQVAQEGFGRGQVYWHKKCPPDGTDLYTTPQLSRVAELEAEIARLKATP